MVSLKHFFQLLRIPQWSKATFVLLGVIYSGANQYWCDALWATLAFCLSSSAVYIYNDLLDREEDRLHHRKRLRPLASKGVSLDFAVSMALILTLAGLSIGFLISKSLAALLICYLLVNFAYNHGLKNAAGLDVLCIASGFMLRVLAGTIGIGLPFSWWLIWTATLLSLLIALAKRRLEKQLYSRMETRKVLKKYSLKVLDMVIICTAVLTLITYVLYCLVVHKEVGLFLLTLPFATLGLWRFVWLSTQKSDVDDPIVLFLQDWVACTASICFFVLTLLALYSH